MTNFSKTFLQYSDGQQNLVKPPNSIMATGFVPKTAISNGQPLPAGWLNWLLCNLYDHINRDVVTDGLGVGLFPINNAMIRLEAVDTANVNNYLIAIGFKSANSAPLLKVILPQTESLNALIFEIGSFSMLISINIFSISLLYSCLFLTLSSFNFWSNYS